MIHCTAPSFKSVLLMNLSSATCMFGHGVIVHNFFYSGISVEWTNGQFHVPTHALLILTVDITMCMCDTNV